MKPAVSILVPICNVQKYLRECVESLVNQTLDNIEIILINDGSKDDSLSIVREFERKDPRIIVIDKPNSGYGDSMNRGLALATGEYVGIVESDDFAALDMFEQLYEAAKKYNAEVVKSNFYAYSTTGAQGQSEELVENLVGCPYDTPFDPTEHQTVFLCRPAIWSGIYRRSFLEENDVKFLPTPGASFQDTGFCFKLLYSAKRAVLLREGFLRYRIDNDGSSVKSQAKIFPICEEYAEIWRYAQRDAIRFDRIKWRIPYQQFGGYRWNLERLVPQIRHQFYVRMIDEFQKIKAAALLDAAYFDAGSWSSLSGMLEDPEGYYLRTYGPDRVEGSFVACLYGLERNEALDCLDTLLGITSDSDELILVHEDSASIVSSLKASDHRAGRVYSDEDLFISSVICNIDQERLRGKHITIVCLESVADARDLSESFVSARCDDSIRVSQFNSGVIVSGPSEELLSSGEDGIVSLPTLILRALGEKELSSIPSIAGSLTKLPSFVESEEFISAAGAMVTLSHDLLDSDYSYLHRKKLFAAALPLWNRVRSSFLLLPDYDAGLARDAFQRMAEASYLEFASPTCTSSATPALSVIVPVFNAERFLDESAASILEQDLQDFEVIFVNDGSPDESLARLEEIACQDARVRVVSQFNCGAGAARNRGIDLARGSALAFIDPDDFYPNNHVLSVLVEGLRRSGSHMCGGSFSLVKPSGKVEENFPFLESFYRSASEEDVKLEHVWNDYGWIRFIYDASIFASGKVRFPQLGWYEDPVFFMKAVEESGGYHLIPDAVYRYRVDYKEVNWTPSRVRDLLDGIAENLSFASKHEMAELYTTLVRRIDFDYLWMILGCIRDEGVLRRIVSIQNGLRTDLILSVRESGRHSYLLRPLVELTSGTMGRDTAVVRLAHKVERSSLYEGIQRMIWRAKGKL